LHSIAVVFLLRRHPLARLECLRHESSARSFRMIRVCKIGIFRSFFSVTCVAVDLTSNLNTKMSTSSRRIGLGWSNFCWENSKWLSSSSSHFVLPLHLRESHKDTSNLHVRRDQPIKDCRPRNLNSVHLESNFFPSLHLKRF